MIIIVVKQNIVVKENLTIKRNKNIIQYNDNYGRRKYMDPALICE